MPGDGHAQPVRLGRNRLQHVRLYRFIRLDLVKTRILIFMDVSHRLHRIVGADRSQRNFAVAIDDPCQQQSRTQPFPIPNRVAHRSDEVEFVSA